MNAITKLNSKKTIIGSFFKSKTVLLKLCGFMSILALAKSIIKGLKKVYFQQKLACLTK